MRIFVGTRVPDGFLDELICALEYLKKEIGCDMNWVKPENFHITYVFLGDVSTDKCEIIIRRMKAERYKKFSISTGNFGCFPLKGKPSVAKQAMEDKPSVAAQAMEDKPKVIWLGINEGASKLEEVAEKLRANLAIDGFVFKNKFFPHITLARVRREEISGKNIEKIFTQALKLIDKKLSFEVLTIELFESILIPEGTVYKSVNKMQLT